MQATVSRKLVGEGERASFDLRLDASQVGARSLQVGLVGDPGERRAKTLSVDGKIEPDPMGASRHNTTCDRLATHNGSLELEYMVAQLSACRAWVNGRLS